MYETLLVAPKLPKTLRRPPVILSEHCRWVAREMDPHHRAGAVVLRLVHAQLAAAEQLVPGRGPISARGQKCFQTMLGQRSASKNKKRFC